MYGINRFAYLLCPYQQFVNLEFTNIIFILYFSSYQQYNILLFMQLTQEDLRPFRQKLALSKNNHLATNLVNAVFANMTSSITTGQLEISSNQVCLSVEKKIQKNENEGQEKKLNQILQKKEILKKQLATIDEQVQNLKMSKLNLSRTSQQSHKHFKSELTPQDRQQLKSLMIQEKKFEKQLLQKTQKYNLRMQKIKEEQQEIRQKIRKQKLQQKKHQVQKTLEVMEKRRNQRLGKISEQKKTLKEIINKKKLHEQWQEKWKTIQEQEQRKKQLLKQEIRKMKKVSHQEIKEHQKKYQEMIKNHKQSRNSIIPHQTSQFYKSVFLEKIQEEEKKQKQIQEGKKTNAKQFLNKIKEYNQKVKINHKPIVKPKQKSQQINVREKSEQNKSLSFFQTHLKGNQYMRAVNQKAAEILKKKDENVVSTNRQNIQPFKYKNYLKQLRRPQSEQQINKKGELSQIKQIMNKQSLTQEQKFYQAKVLAEKLENRQVIRSPQGLVSSINAKIQILRQVDF